MNYKKHYNALMERARWRVINGYSEKHHVLPRCLGGSNASDNIVVLTAREHYVAHQLLVKLYPTHVGLAYAAVKMAMNASGSRAYNWLRQHNATLMIGNTRALGAVRSIETRLRMSVARRNRIVKPFSDEHKANLSAACRGRKLPPLSAEHKAKLSAARKGKPAPWIIESNKRRAAANG